MEVDKIMTTLLTLGANSSTPRRHGSAQNNENIINRVKFLLWADSYFFRRVSGQLPSLKDSPDNFYIFVAYILKILGQREGGL